MTVSDDTTGHAADEQMVERIARIIATHIMNAEYVKTHGISYYLPVAEALYARGFRLVDAGLLCTPPERAVIDLTIKHHQHLAYMRDQPWHGRPVQPPDRVAANRQLRELEYALADAVDRLAAPGPSPLTCPECHAATVQQMAGGWRLCSTCNFSWLAASGPKEAT